MRTKVSGGFLLLAVVVAPLRAQAPKYPALSEYLMAPDAELALALSAAPESVSSHATVKVLTRNGYQVARTGDNGFTCLVLRGWAAPAFTPANQRGLVYESRLRAPICFDPVASRAVLPLQEFKARLGLAGRDPDTIAREVSLAYAQGRLPRMESVAFAYMLSADQWLGERAQAWHPHLMVYAPYYSNAMLGGNPFGGPLPFVNDDEGTPFTVIVVRVAGDLAIAAGEAAHRHP